MSFELVFLVNKSATPLPGPDSHRIWITVVSEIVFIRLNKSPLHNPATYWLQELYLWTECLLQKLKLFLFMHLQLFSQSGKQMKSKSAPKTVVGENLLKDIL